jgi:hypothetical protein
MKKSGLLSHRVQMGLLLILLSFLAYALHYAIFRDAHHIAIYLLGDIGFVFLEVLLVTLILHQILTEREKRALLKKLNMVIGAFFSEVGTSLLRYFRDFDKEADSIAQRLMVDAKWSPEQFDRMRQVLEKHDYSVDSRIGDLAGLRELLIAKRAFLLRLLENPNLLEHESFTELLWAVFHLAEELSHRSSVEGLPENDYHHLSGDINRSYALLVREWLSHMEHLKADYPYLFSLAVRLNPFDAKAAVELA